MKLTEINIENISDEVIRDVLFSSQKSEYVKADCLIIFGCHMKNLLDERLKHAVSLFESKEIDKILVTGGVGAKGDFNESEYMVNYLVKSGVIMTDIIIENKSTTTEENIINSIKLLEGMNLLENKNLVLVSNQAHLRRIGMEFKKQLKNINYSLYYEFPDVSDISYDSLLKDEKLKDLGKNEVKKIISFIKQGIIDDEEVS